MLRKGIKEWVQGNENQGKIITFATIVLFLMVMIPLFVIARYAVKSADDYGNFWGAEQVWAQSHSLWQLICYSAATTKKIYMSWQGTYFNEFLQGILGGICGDKFYSFGAYLTLVMFLVGQMYLFYVVLVKMLNADKYSYITVTLSCIMMEVLLIPSPAEAFYWFCGSMMYLFPWALSAILVAVCVRTILLPMDSSKRVIRTEILILFLMVAVAGSNYISLISTLVIWMLLCAWSWLIRNRSRIFLSVNGIIYILLSVANILAPGNQNRLSSAENSGWAGYSVMESIVQSLYEALKYITSNFVLPYIIMGLLLVPVFIKIARNSEFRFRFPMLISILSFGVFAAQFTPNLYTLGFIGAYRILNIYKISMTILVYWTELYWIGYLIRRNEGEEYKKTKNSILLPMWAVGIGMFVFSLTLWGGSTVTTWSAIQSLRSGEAAGYKAEYEARINVLEDESVKEVHFKEYTYKPYLLYRDDLSKNAEDWINKSVAKIYDKDLVVVD